MQSRHRRVPLFLTTFKGNAHDLQDSLRFRCLRLEMPHFPIPLVVSQIPAQYFKLHDGALRVGLGVFDASESYGHARQCEESRLHRRYSQRVEEVPSAYQ